MAVLTTAAAATAAATAGAAAGTAATTAATVGTIAAGVGAVGQAVMSRKASLKQKEMANIQNARERKKSLSAMRLARARQEAMGVASGTTGSSSQVGAMSAETSNAASAIGFQGQMLAGMNKVSGYNSAATGFGLLEQGGSFVQKNPELTGSMGKSLFS